MFALVGLVYGKERLRNIGAYLNNLRPFPTTIEIDLTNHCNHRC